MTERFSDATRDVCHLALRQALSLGHNYIQPEHLLLVLIKQPGGIAGRALDKIDVEPAAFRKAVLEAIGDVLREEGEKRE